MIDRREGDGRAWKCTLCHDRLRDEPEVYGLPPDPVVPTRDAPAMWRYAGMAASALVAATVTSFLGRGRR